MAEPKIVDKVAYKVVTVEDMFHLITKYHHLSNYEHACKLLVEEGLLILKKDGTPIKDTNATPNITT